MNFEWQVLIYVFEEDSTKIGLTRETEIVEDIFMYWQLEVDSYKRSTFFSEIEKILWYVHQDIVLLSYP